MHLVGYYYKNYYYTVCEQNFLVVTFIQLFVPKFCTHISFPLYVMHGLLNCFWEGGRIMKLRTLQFSLEFSSSLSTATLPAS